MRLKIVLPTAALILAAAAGAFSLERSRTKPVEGYQAVLLDNNQVYYGKLSRLSSDYPTLTDVYYVQTAVNPETKQASNVLLKRGKEWHGPDKMLLSARHIIMIEPVSAGSTVSKLIEQANHK